MGTTIRREPVTTSIPAAPDYRFLNITNFGGIEKSSNPFVVESNTASDCLNVYVDEDNALSTRPRLQRQTDFIKDVIDKFPALGLTGAFDLIGVYDLHDGYLIHGVENDIYYMFKYVDENSIHQITGDKIPTEKCKIFEQSDVIYVLDGQKYRNIKNFVISEVEGYVPLVTVGKNKRTESIASDGTKTVTYDYGGTSLESLNLLSDKVKESYFWDGTWNIKDLGDDYETASSFEKTTQWSIDIETSNLSRYDVFRLIPKYIPNEFDNNKYVLLRHKVENEDKYVIKIGVLDGNSNTLNQLLPIIEPENLPDVTASVSADCNDDATVIALRYETLGANVGAPGVIRYGGVFLYNALEKTWYDLDEGNKDYVFYATDTGRKSIAVSSDGSVVVTMCHTELYRNAKKLAVYKYNNNSKKYDRFIISFDPDVYEDLGYEPRLIGVDVSEDGSSIYGVFAGTNDTSIGAVNDLIFADHLYYTKTENIQSDVTVNLNNYANTGHYFLNVQQYVEKPGASTEVHMARDIAIHPDGKTIYVTYYSGEVSPLLFNDIYSWKFPSDDSYVKPESIELPVREKTTDEYVYRAVYSPYFTDGKLFVLYGDTTDDVKSGYFILDNTDRFIPTLVKVPKFFKGANRVYATNDSYFFVNWSDVTTQTPIFVYTKLDFDSVEPNVTVTIKLKDSQIDITNYKNIQDIFNNSNLLLRFDNNTWFASGNYTFHTLYNDPTYIPLSGYNDLGESFEPITGLSIVNDNILAAYKRNRIYIITPITVGNELTYSYTETKNIIGNDVVDAPTLTILTEMPILVSYNGIYALNQLENVQSSDRITTLISEAMNPKWLKESQTDIDSCLVLNRLYWTYFILPHKKSTNGLIKDNNHTKVYLLDNRTGSWFYWELPIYVISAMVKNNKTHFVTEDGELFTLETTDIINKFNKDLTEYYDDLKKPTLIPWNWTSQILSLNTINYSKRLVDTTFVLTDTDMSDEYALNYKFKAFRKNKNAETTELTLTNDIEYVESITKRTMIPRFNFIQFTLSNTEDDEKLNNNKLRLVGLGLKYVLLGGLY